MSRREEALSNKNSKRRYQKPQLKKYKSLRKKIQATIIGITEI
jgi:hypothetical protein